DGRLHRAQAGREGDAGGYHRLVPQEPRRLQMPALRRVRRTAADLDRENPEIQAARHGEGGVSNTIRIRSCCAAPGTPGLGFSDCLLVIQPPSTASPEAAASGRSTAA